MGVRGITLKSSDYIISMESFDPEEPVAKDKRSKIFRDILMVTEFGLGKRTPLKEYPVQNKIWPGLKVSETTENR